MDTSGTMHFYGAGTHRMGKTVAIFACQPRQGV